LPAPGRARNIAAAREKKDGMAADTAPPPPLGFIGLGAMGLPMARNLLRHGRALLACDTDPAARNALAGSAEAADAVRFAAAPAAVAEAAETVILVLPDSEAVARWWKARAA
jgi:3-hydroxyisobutyrate dehydrogenase-like beta-hydroxyacid dehydrogenase